MFPARVPHPCKLPMTRQLVSTDEVPGLSDGIIHILHAFPALTRRPILGLAFACIASNGVDPASPHPDLGYIWTSKPIQAITPMQPSPLQVRWFSVQSDLRSLAYFAKQSVKQLTHCTSGFPNSGFTQTRVSKRSSNKW